MIASAITVLRSTAPGVALGTALPAGPVGPSAYKITGGDAVCGSRAVWLASLVGTPGVPGTLGPAPTVAKIQAAVQLLVGASSGLADLGASSRPPLA